MRSHSHPGAVPSRSILLVLAVSSVGQLRSAPGQLCISPANETCAGATDIFEWQLPLSVNGVYGCTTDTIPNPDMPYLDVFFRYDCTCTGIYTLAMCGSTADAALRVYVDGCGFLAGDEIATADDECAGSPPSADPLLDIVLEDGRSYWFELGTWRPTPPWAPSAPNAPLVFDMSACRPCGSGDANRDGELDSRDIAFFMATLLGASQDALTICGSDMTNNGSVELDDIELFVTALLQS